MNYIPSLTHLFALALVFANGFAMFTLPVGHNAIAEFFRSAIGLWIVSAIAQSLPAPGPSAGNFYRFVYKFINVIGANLSHAGITVPPPDTTPEAPRQPSASPAQAFELKKTAATETNYKCWGCGVNHPASDLAFWDGHSTTCPAAKQGDQPK